MGAGQARRSRLRAGLIELCIGLGMAIASVLLLLLVLEWITRLLGYQPIYELYSKPSILWRPDSLLGWSHEPGSRETYVGPRPWPIEFETQVRINSLGLRGPEVAELAGPGRRVLALGDSVVAGFEVEEEQTFVWLLQDMLGRELGLPVQMINAGVRGYGTDQGLLYFRERGRLLEPDLVLFVHSNNDPANNVTLHRMRRPFGKPAFVLRPDGSLELVGRPVPEYPLCSAYRLSESGETLRMDTPRTRAFCSLQASLFDRSALFTILAFRIRANPALLKSIYGLGSAPESVVAEEYPFRLTTALILELAREARAAGAGFALLIQKNQLARLERAALDRAGIEPWLMEDLEEGAEPRSLRFKADGHYNATGHRRAADFLAPRLAARLRAGGDATARPAAAGGAG